MREEKSSHFVLVTSHFGSYISLKKTAKPKQEQGKLLVGKISGKTGTVYCALSD